MTPILCPKRFSHKSASPQPRGRVPRFAWDTGGKGTPRTEDVLAIRRMENTPAIAIPMNIILSQLQGNDWEVCPDEEHENSPAHLKACEDIITWMQGRFNANEDSWDAFMSAWGRDIVSIGSGVVEMVGNSTNPNVLSTHVTDMYVRDAATFTKWIDEFGRVPGRDYIDKKTDKHRPAYWQWGGNLFNLFRQMGPQSAQRQQFDAQSQYLYQVKAITPVPFERDEIMWTDLNPRSYYAYGRGRVADAMMLAEVILNLDLYNKDYFTGEELPEGLISMKGAGANEVMSFIDYYRAEMAGQPNKVGIVGAPEGVQWIPFRATQRELQYLESNRYFRRLVYMIFGLSDSEVGDEEATSNSLGTSGAAARQHSTDVWRKTTFPLLSLMQEDINRQLIPRLEPYIRVKGGIYFKFKISHPDAEDQMRARQDRDIETGVTTINDALRERGVDPVKWGDMPKRLSDTLIDRHPEWFYENFTKFDGKPTAPKPAPVMTFSHDPEVEDLFRVPVEPAIKSVSELEDIAEDDFNGAGTLYAIARRLVKDVETIITDEVGRAIGEIAGAWPTKAWGLPPQVSEIIGRLKLALPIAEAIAQASDEVLDDTWVHDAEEVAAELRRRIGSDIAIDVARPGEGSLWAQLLHERAREHAVGIEDDVQSQLSTVLHEAADGEWSVDELTGALRERASEISYAKARTVARTEIMQARRDASRAFGSQADIIGGKRWVATLDRRTRDWHKAMHKVVMRKDMPFTVPGGFEDQPDGFPKDTMSVGGSDPWNCRCSHQHVLRDDMPDDIQTLCAQYPQVVMK